MPTVGEVVQRTIALRSPGLAPRTVESYQRLAGFVMASPLALAPDGPESAPLASLLLAQQLDRGHGRTAEQLYVFLRMCSPRLMDGVKRPKFQRRSPVFVSAEEAARLLRAAEGSPLKLAVWLALCCGLRRGELAGLRWVDVDPAAGCLHVRNQRQRIKGKGLVDGPPKSASGVRDVPVPADLMAMLCDAQFSAAAESLLDGQNRPYVLSGPAGQGTDPNALDKGFSALCSAAGVRCTVHGLRHTMATIGSCAGVPLRILQQILGHASASTTAAYYAHVYDDALTEAAKTIRLKLPKTPDS